MSSAEDLAALQETHESFALGAFASLDSASAKSFMSLAAGSEDQVTQALVSLISQSLSEVFVYLFDFDFTFTADIIIIIFIVNVCILLLLIN